jgi:Tol biopolymer transport system component
MRSAAVVLAGVVAAALISLDARQSVGDSVVYSQERDGNHDLYIVSDNGTNPRRLTTDPLPDEIPRCSPDGRFVAFLRGGFQHGDLFRIDLETGEERRLTNDTYRDSTPSWSPDGSRIYFTRRVGEFDRLAVMSADGGDVRFLTDGERWHDTMPAVSPDGQTLVHHTYRYAPGTELQLLDLRTRTSRRLTFESGFDYEASFVEADQVIFSSNRDGGHYRIYATSIAEGTTRLVADTGADAWNSRYSARSGRILFHSGSPGRWRLFIATLSGNNGAKPFLDDGTSKSGADWCVALRSRSSSFREEYYEIASRVAGK